jgi:tRNA A37 threonylcarbamoyladenosine dehydratase
MGDNMLNEFSRTQLLLGPEAMERLAQARVAVFGIGGVGGYAVEALARSGIGALDLIDDDRICLTNINRQLLATHKSVGKYKVDMAAARITEINPRCKVRTCKTFYLPETADQFDFSCYSYVIDAIDTVSGKIQLVLAAQLAHVPIISSMGAGNKLDPTAFRVADIYKTRMDPLARVMRRELKKRGVKELKVVYSEEQPIRPLEDMSISCRAHCICPPGTKRHCTDRRDIPGSIAFVPSVAGLILAGEVVKDLCSQEEEQR